MNYTAEDLDVNCNLNCIVENLDLDLDCLGGVDVPVQLVGLYLLLRGLAHLNNHHANVSMEIFKSFKIFLGNSPRLAVDRSLPASTPPSLKSGH